LNGRPFLCGGKKAKKKVSTKDPPGVKRTKIKEARRQRKNSAPFAQKKETHRKHQKVRKGPS